MKTVYLYVPEGMADWEPSFVLPELRKAGFPVQTFAERTEPLTTIGGLRIVPDTTLAGVRLDDAALVLLPGSDSWADPTQHRGVLEIAQATRKKQVPLAAICAGTVALARLGFLDGVRHTSNDLTYLQKMVPAYKGAALYQRDQLAVTDGTLVTASAVGAVEFARELLTLLKVKDATWVNQWFELYKHAVVPPWLKA